MPMLERPKLLLHILRGIRMLQLFDHSHLERTRGQAACRLLLESAQGQSPSQLDLYSNGQSKCVYVIEGSLLLEAL